MYFRTKTSERHQSLKIDDFLISTGTGKKWFPAATRSKEWVCGRSLAGIAVSSPTGRLDVSFLCVLYVVKQRSLRRADHSSREVVPSVVC